MGNFSTVQHKYSKHVHNKLVLTIKSVSLSQSLKLTVFFCYCELHLQGIKIVFGTALTVCFAVQHIF